MSAAPYNQNEELVAMKDDISSRRLHLNIKSGLIAGLTIAGGALAGIAALPVLLPGMAIGSAALMGGVAGGYGGLFLSDMMTTKDREKLRIDDEYLQQYMQGKGNWGEGYRREVAEHGYSLAGPAFPGAQPPQPARTNTR